MRTVEEPEQHSENNEIAAFNEILGTPFINGEVMV
jgi:hypothetical protein